MRGFRPRQKGLDCTVGGCSAERTGNDLCQKHNQAVHRYGSVDGKVKTKRVCKNPECSKEFEHKYDNAEYCNGKCYRAMPENKAKAYQAVKKHRLKKAGKEQVGLALMAQELVATAAQRALEPYDGSEIKDMRTYGVNI